jgi:hypothetical protein
MINISKAQSLVESELSKMSRDMPPEEKRVIVNVLPIEDLGWIFFYDTKAFAEDHDPMYELAGNAPIIVDREDGSLHVTGTGRPIEEYMEEFRKKKEARK